VPALLVSETAQAAVRALLLAGIMLVVGAVLFMARIAPLFDVGSSVNSTVASTAVSAVRRRALHMLRLAVTLVAIALAWRLVQQAAAFADAPSEWTSTVSLVLLQTSWGTGWLVQGAGLVLVAVASGASTRRAGAAWLPLGIGVLALAASPALSGHAIGAPRLVALAVAADTLHVLGAGAWLGTLLVIVVAALPAVSSAAPGTLLAMLDRFSPLALASAGAVVLSGAFASWLHLGALDALWTSPYGRTLLVKLGIVACVAALGAYNWRVVTPRLRATGEGAALRRSALVELSLALLLVVVTALLVATPLPAEM